MANLLPGTERVGRDGSCDTGLNPGGGAVGAGVGRLVGVVGRSSMARQSSMTVSSSSLFQRLRIEPNPSFCG